MRRGETMTLADMFFWNLTAIDYINTLRNVQVDMQRDIDALRAEVEALRGGAGGPPPQATPAPSYVPPPSAGGYQPGYTSGATRTGHYSSTGGHPAPNM